MMRARGRRSRPARWSYADSTGLSVSNGTPTAFVWLLPPARVSFMLSQRGRGNSMVFAGAHLWLDFDWASSNSSVQGLPDVDFGVIKTTISDPTAFTPDLSLVDAQWDQPSTPATLTSWDEDDDSGVDSWLWQHHIKGQTPPNFHIQAGGDGAGELFNQQQDIGGGSSDSPAHMCRKFHVTQEWQPDVVIRSKRRLQKDEGILLYMNAQISVAQVFATLDVRLRTLTK